MTHKNAPLASEGRRRLVEHLPHTPDRALEVLGNHLSQIFRAAAEPNTTDRG